MEKNWEKILVLGGEGGSVTLFGLRAEESGWIFMKETNESALIDLFDDEDLSSIAINQSKEVYQWSAALELLGRHFGRLVPRYVHPDFKDLVWEEVKQIAQNHNLSRWERICS
ncbi:hypothetical protein PY093_20140 [Cytobacillus sp. S13-E01]|uniref:hypothetical protein n=1 Tax=Cytobacillus sp. S13-E01 TaxID=3031326 RepID=UPI0023D7C61F|nr:hypothetical protein [Cytobacillus sp. S13-E01]MDF0728926.1 hypothetical protein [Cytobacillus sp. S13-E01]